MVQYMATPTSYVIARDRFSWHLGDFRNILLTILGEDQDRGFLARCHMVNLALQLLHYVHKKLDEGLG